MQKEQFERCQEALDKQRKAEEEMYYNKIKEEVLARMEYLRNEWERLRAEYEDNLRVQEEERQRVEEERR